MPCCRQRRRWSWGGQQGWVASWRPQLIRPRWTASPSGNAELTQVRIILRRGWKKGKRMKRRKMERTDVSLAGKLFRVQRRRWSGSLHFSRRPQLSICQETVIVTNLNKSSWWSFLMIMVLRRLILLYIEGRLRDFGSCGTSWRDTQRLFRIFMWPLLWNALEKLCNKRIYVHI